MYEFLQNLFGTAEDGSPVALTFDQLVEKLTADKSLKLVNLSDGGYVAKEKFDAKETELAGIRQQLTEANTTIQSYKDMDIDGVKQSVKDWEAKYNTDTQALRDQLAAQERAHQEDRFFAGYHFRDQFAEAGARAAFAKQEFKLNDAGEFVGAKAWMEGLMADEKYKDAFVTEKKEQDPPPKKDPQFTNPNPQKTPPDEKGPFDFNFTAVRNPKT